MRRSILTALLAGLSLTLIACASTGSVSGERFRGNLAAIGGPGGGGTTFLDLHVDRVATDAEIDALATTLVEGGEKALFDAVAKTDPMGWIRIGANTRYHLRVIRSIDTPEGRVIRAITDRKIYFAEIIRPLRTRDYSYGIIELQLDDQGRGTGGIIAAAEITFNDGTVEIESFGNQPYRVLNVKPVALK